MEKYQEYVNILKEELVVAMGCTEPIAIAYCASLLKETLKHLPSKVDCFVSGNILKNVKSVIVPNTNKNTGIETAIAIGLLCGNAKDELEVIAKAKKEDIAKLDYFLKNTPINVDAKNTTHTLYIELVGYYNNDVARVIIQDAHTNIYLIELNDKTLYKNLEKIKSKKIKTDKSILNVKDIFEFANTCDINLVKKVLDRQIKYNMNIAKEGIKNNYGANIGKTLLKYVKSDVINSCKAYASAASDARMNGCEMPVVINSGSGNQGITCSVPVIVYAKQTKKSKEELYKALLISNLITIHIKNTIGKLSAFCGVVIAGVGAGAGIAYLEEKSLESISHTIVNSLAMISGVVCDGAKSSCAAKISSSVEAGILGYFMYKDGNEFLSGEGIVKSDVEATIKAIGKLASVGMCELDKEIIHIMIDE